MASIGTNDTDYDVRYVLEIDGSDAGVIIQDGRQVRFFATSPIYAHLDRALFRSPDQAERACQRARSARATEMTAASGRPARLGLVTYSRDQLDHPFATNSNGDWDAAATVGG